MQPRKVQRAAQTFVQRDWVPAEKTDAFFKLLDSLAKDLGSFNKACVYCGVESGNLKHVIDGKHRLTAMNAKKILEGFRRMKAEKACK